MVILTLCGRGNPSLEDLRAPRELIECVGPKAGGARDGSRKDGMSSKGRFGRTWRCPDRRASHHVAGAGQARAHPRRSLQWASCSRGRRSNEREGEWGGVDSTCAVQEQVAAVSIVSHGVHTQNLAHTKTHHPMTPTRYNGLDSQVLQQLLTDGTVLRGVARVTL
jgi:hypothetical protein